MTANDEFQFLDPGPLRDGELELVLVARSPADPVKHWVPSYDFELRVGGERAGEINFRAVDAESLRLYGGHFAYGVEPTFRGQHFAERGVRLLFPFVRRHGFTTVYVTCNPDNWPSRRTCERLGATLVEIIPLPPDNDMYLAGEREKCRYRVDLDASAT
jgi:predicted acetyltransferase